MINNEKTMLDPIDDDCLKLFSIPEFVKITKSNVIVNGIAMTVEEFKKSKNENRDRPEKSRWQRRVIVGNYIS